ncbi:hypothetical protein RVR_4606 [Actinacidiphila reveromycinica]|uniref:DUF4232 domain-containing protein n=1 Tax=Actinacidiphila reveromycinica TaxID=659352 RepID=A0A7U3UT92_9ACTN|nr:DUF4232 domain-containing protein [Streptomyces sp. SN-593]BBA98432.1 hypothetical protein RVR_4606 [Streptomyces sp. SN-593]
MSSTRSSHTRTSHTRTGGSHATGHTRTGGTRARLAVTAAAVVVAALSMTACTDDGTGSRDEGAAHGGPSTTAPAPAGTPHPSGTPTAPAARTPETDAASKAPAAGGTAGQSGGSKAAGASGRTGSGGAAGGAVTCEGSTTKMTAAPLNRPVNHMLLTVTNTGDRTCYLYGYPALDFTGAQAVPPVVEESHPQAVVTLFPGESGYASVRLSAADGSGRYGYTAKTLAVLFSGRSGAGSVGAAAHPALPAEGVYIDDTLTTTYWQQTMDEALTW